jgi:DNA-binding SARP family transcriptional activator
MPGDRPEIFLEQWMDSPLSSNQRILMVQSEAPSLDFLLERGMYYTRQGYYAEGVSYFALARDQLTQNQLHFVAVLDVLIRSSSGYLEAQHSLLLASKHLLELDVEQQNQLAILEKLLPVLKVPTDKVPQLHVPVRQPENSSARQSPPFPQLSQNSPDFEQSSLTTDSQPEGSNLLHTLDFTCFGRFEARRLGRPVTLCSNRNGQAILRYLVAQPGHSATVDTLMAMLWPEDELEVAQPKLHIAISALRRSLNEGYTCGPDCGYILCKNRVYRLNPAVVIRTDVDEFLQCYQAGRGAKEGGESLYERACRHYTGPFLPEDMYADWSFLQREQLSQTYLTMCKALADYYFNNGHYEDAAQWATGILKENRCDEGAHRQLIQIYAAQGSRSKALQQYQRCVRVLREDLSVQPLPETMLVFQALLGNEPLPNKA